MKLPGWLISAACGAGVLGAIFGAKVGIGWVGSMVSGRGIDPSEPGPLGVLGVVASGGALGGAVHHWARRLIACRPWGAYLYGVVIGEVYLFAIGGGLLVVKGLGGDRAGALADLRGWPVVVGGGLVGGLLWGWLSRNDDRG